MNLLLFFSANFTNSTPLVIIEVTQSINALLIVIIKYIAKSRLNKQRL
jgi:hypothetical protein